jgi:hypothetical protein
VIRPVDPETLARWKRWGFHPEKLTFEQACAFLCLGGPIPQEDIADYWREKVPDLNPARLRECINALIRAANTAPDSCVEEILRQYIVGGRELLGRP